MYLPEFNKQEDVEEMRELVRQVPLGVIVLNRENGLYANHIPFQWTEGEDGPGSLVGHVARNNDMWRQDAPVDCLVIFQGPEAYVSPNWYPSKHEHHRAVPTWNYAVLHVHGKLIIHDDEKWLRGVIGKLTKAMEAKQPEPWLMAQAPRDFLKTMLENIVGVEVQIERLEGKWKLGQNRKPEDRQGVITGLEAVGTEASDEVARLMREANPSS